VTETRRTHFVLALFDCAPRSELMQAILEAHSRVESNNRQLSAVAG